MAKNIVASTKMLPPGEIPSPGKKTGRVMLRAEFILTKVVAALPASKKNAAMRGTKAKIAEIIRAGVEEEWKKSTLKSRTGKLKRAAKQFKVEIIVTKNRIIVKAIWTPKLAYFFAHLFGVKIKITPKMRVYLHANDIIHPRATTKMINIPRRNFLAFRRKTRTKIAANVITPAFADSMKAESEKRKVKEVGRGIAGTRGQVSAFRARRQGLTRQETRDLKKAEALLGEAEEIVQRLGPLTMRGIS